MYNVFILKCASKDFLEVTAVKTDSLSETHVPQEQDVLAECSHCNAAHLI